MIDLARWSGDHGPRDFFRARRYIAAGVPEIFSRPKIDESAARSLLLPGHLFRRLLDVYSRLGTLRG